MRCDGCNLLSSETPSPPSHLILSLSFACCALLTPTHRGWPSLAGAFEALVTAMKTFDGKKAVVDPCVKTLRTLTSGNPDLRKEALDAGAKAEWVAK